MIEKMISMAFSTTDQILMLVKMKSKSESKYETDNSQCFVEWKK